MRFEDKVVWITGASAGIGRAMALEFAREGAHLALSARREDRLTELVAGIEALDRQALAVPCDVTDDPAVAAAVARTVEHFGRLDVAVANAGYGATGPTATLGVDAWRRQFDVNVLGVVSTYHHAFPHLLESGGRIALMSSVAAFVFGAKAAPYSASKAAVHQMTKILAKECASRRITFNAFAPGPFPSRMTAFATGTEEKQEAVGQDIPLGRVGRAQDMAGAALYLCSRAGAYVTGCILPLDGGIGVMTGGDLWEKGRD